MTDVDRAYVVTDRPLPAEFAEGFGPPELIATVPLDIRGAKTGTFNIRLYTKLDSHDLPVDESPRE